MFLRTPLPSGATCAHVYGFFTVGRTLWSDSSVIPVALWDAKIHLRGWRCPRSWDPRWQQLIVLLSANRLSQIPPAGRHDSGSDTSCIKHGFDFFFFLPLLGTCVRARVSYCISEQIQSILPCCLANWWLLNIHISHFTSQPETRKCERNGCAGKKGKHAHDATRAQNATHTHTHTQACALLEFH